MATLPPLDVPQVFTGPVGGDAMRLLDVKGAAAQTDLLTGQSVRSPRLDLSAKEVLITARNPNCVSAHGACSRELPQPKLSPASRTSQPRARGWLRMKSGFGFPCSS